MDPLALAFIALAAVLHAAWNVLLKTADDPLWTATVGLVAVSVVLVPAVAMGWLRLGRPAIPNDAWLLGVASGGVEVVYFLFLAAAYRRGDLSLVYPLARGSAPLLAIMLGVGVLGERLAPGAILGVALLVASLLIVQRPWRLLRAAEARDDRSAAGFALLTGAMIASYSAIDRVGVQLVPPWLYAGILWPTCALGLGLIAIVRARRGDVPVATMGVGAARRRAVSAGVLTVAAYGLVLAALRRAPLAVVAPLRESAVLLATTWGVVRLREARDPGEVSRRIVGAMLVLAGAGVLAIAR